MKIIECWYEAPNQSELNDVLESMTLEERKELDKRVNSVLCNIRFDYLSERLIAKEYLIMGILLSKIKFLTEEEKKTLIDSWKS
jgi:hypothetical protein